MDGQVTQFRLRYLECFEPTARAADGWTVHAEILGHLCNCASGGEECADHCFTLVGRLHPSEHRSHITSGGFAPLVAVRSRPECLTRQGYLIREQGMRYLADAETDTSMAPLQTDACTYCIALGRAETEDPVALRSSASATPL